MVDVVMMDGRGETITMDELREAQAVLRRSFSLAPLLREREGANRGWRLYPLLEPLAPTLWIGREGDAYVGTTDRGQRVELTPAHIAWYERQEGEWRDQVEAKRRAGELLKSVIGKKRWAYYAKHADIHCPETPMGFKYILGLGDPVRVMAQRALLCNICVEAPGPGEDRLAALVLLIESGHEAEIWRIGNITWNHAHPWFDANRSALEIRKVQEDIGRYHRPLVWHPSPDEEVGLGGWRAPPILG